MKTINNIAVFDNDKYILAMLRGYCYANDISMTEVKININWIHEVEALNPALIFVSMDLLSMESNSLQTALLRRAAAKKQIKICVLNKKSSIVSDELSSWFDIIKNPFDLVEIDQYIKSIFLLPSIASEERRRRERRSFTERRYAGFNSHVGGSGNEAKKPDYRYEAGHPEFKDFRIDRRNKCVFLNGHKVELTRKEYELFELLSTDVDRIFLAEEIIDHLWPENSRATKSDLYQYMHLLRKKIEKNPNNPQWIMTVKGFGYKLNIANTEEYQEAICL